jgi:hypothetical protein
MAQRKKTKERQFTVIVDEKCQNMNIQNTQFNDYEMVGLLKVALDIYSKRFNLTEGAPNGTAETK